MNKASAQDEETWKYELTIYGWYSGVDADIGLPNGPGSGDDITIETSNIIDNLQMILMSTFEARNDRWALVADVIYMDVSDDEDRNLYAPSSGKPVNASIDVGITSWVLTGGIAYDVVQSPHGTFAIAGGARLLTADVDVNLGLKGPLSIADPSIEVSDTETYVDGFVGVRGSIVLNEHWYLPYYADIGTGESDLTWQTLVGVGYRFGWGDIRLAYRYMSYDFGDDKFMQNLALSGPVLGAGFRF